MDVSIALGQALAAASVLVLPPGPASEPGDPVYALASGRILLRVRLGGEARSGEAPAPVAERPGLQGEVASYLVSDWAGFEPASVRLVPSARTRIRRAVKALVAGFEHPLVRPAAALVASGFMSFALAGLVHGGMPEAPGALPTAAERPARRGFEDPSRWERDLLLADVGAPAPHTFQRVNAHTNVQVTHTNAPISPHTNTFTAHTNNDLRPIK